MFDVLLNTVNTKRVAASMIDQVPDLAGSIPDYETFGGIQADAKPANVDIPNRQVRFADMGVMSTPINTWTTPGFPNLSATD